MYSEKKSEKIDLEWRDPYNNKQYPAGVAFHEEEAGDYRLKVDAFSKSRRYYVKIEEYSNGEEIYRVESVHGKKRQREVIGEGYVTDTGSIKCTIPPYDKSLVLKKVK